MTLSSRAKGQAIAALVGARAHNVWRARDALRRRGAAPLLEVFHRPDDPYSHVLLDELARLRTQAAMPPLQLHLLDMPDRSANPDPERLAPYALRDVAAVGAWRDICAIAATAPPPRALVDDAATVLAATPGADADLDLWRQVGAALFSGDAAAMAQLAQRHGAASAAATAARRAAGRERLHALGHYQGAMVHWRGEWFWGFDRLEYLADRLTADGFGPWPRPLPPWRREPPPPPPATRPVPVDFFFSFRSPYSYLALDRVLAWPRRLNVELRIHVVPPMVRRGLPVPPGKRLYIVYDCAREARRLGIPFGHIADPLRHVERALHLVPLALRAGRLAETILSIARGVWAEALELGSDRDLRTMVERAGLDWRDAKSALSGDAWSELAARNVAALNALGLWGVPSFHVAGHSATGQDRIWLVEQWIAAAGRVP